MFYGYSLNQWLGVLEYFAMVLALGVGVYIASVWLSNLCYDDNKKCKSNRVRKNRKDHKKQVFFDVA